MPNSFGDQQVINAVNWYEKLPYTFLGPIGLVTTTPIFQVLNVGTVSNKTKMAIVSDLAPDAVTNLNLNINTENNNRALVTSAFPGSLTPVLKRTGSGFRSTGSISLSPQNLTGAAIASYAVNYSAAVKRLTTADKILRGLALTPRDQILASRYQIGDTGFRPLDLEDVIDRAFMSQIIEEDVITVTTSATAQQQIPVTNLLTRQDEILVITSIGMSAAAGNGVTLNIDRDSNLGYVSVLADNMSLTTLFDTWIPVKQQMNVYITATTTTSAIVYMTVLRLRFSKVVQYLFGTITGALTPQDQQLIDEIEAGVLV